MNNLLWGDLWSDYYYKPIKMPVLDLNPFSGGVPAFKRGGGFQTKLCSALGAMIDPSNPAGR